jgi:hypothetical protein
MNDTNETNTIHLKILTHPTTHHDEKTYKEDSTSINKSKTTDANVRMHPTPHKPLIGVHPATQYAKSTASGLALCYRKCMKLPQSQL